MGQMSTSNNHLDQDVKSPCRLTKKWVSRAAQTGLNDTEIQTLALAISQELRIPLLTSSLLVLRGQQTPHAARSFLNGGLSHLPSPLLMKGMDRACSRLAKAILNHEPIQIHSDFDQDGQSACAVLVEALRELGADVSFFVPLRERDGYGLSAAAIRAASADGIKVIVSCDCGISNVEEAKICAAEEIDLIITDHHEPPKILPSAYAIVNPHQHDCKFPDNSLCGAGVAFFLMIGLRKRLREVGYFNSRPEPDLRNLLDLVALATIADLVPIGNGINRILVRSGIKYMEAGHRAGLAAMRQVAEVKRISTGTIGFFIAPRFNAGGRLGDARMGVELLLETDIKNALATAATLDRMNRERQEIEASTVANAIEEVERGGCGKRTIVLASKEFHPGVIGVAASRLVERYHRPTVLIALDPETGIGKGSCRSIRGFNMHKALTNCAPYLQKFGGHEFAAGLSINPEDVEPFANALDNLAIATLSDLDMVPELGYDAEVVAGDLSLEIVTSFSKLEPFGIGNAGPNFIMREVQTRDIRILKDKHLKFLAKTKDDRHIACIGFGLAEYAASMEGRVVDILFSPSINEWNGSTSVQCEVKDIRIAS